MTSSQYPVFTIGHSNHTLGNLLALVRRHRVEEVVDVRSSPFSQYSPHFNRDFLRDALGREGIGYSFLGAELGGRPTDRSCYDAEGRLMYALLADTDLFDDGIRILMRASRDRRVAVMCSEKEPLDCHRALLIAKVLHDRGVAVEHILAEGSVEDHDVTMDRLLDRFKLPVDGDMFRSRDAVIEEALARQASRVAFVDHRVPGDSWRIAL